MAESTSVALAAAPIPSSADIARAEKLVRERFLHEGEDPRGRARPRHAAPARARPGARRARGGPQAQNIPRPPGGASSRCCSASSGCSPRRSPSSPTARCSPPTRSTRCRARSTALLAEAQRSGVERQRPRRRLGLARAARLGRHPRPRRSADGAGADGRRAQAADGRRRGGRGGRGGRGRGGRVEEDDEDLGPVAARRAGRGRRGRRRRGRRGRRRGATRRTTRSPSEEAEAEEEPRDWVEEDDEEESLAEQPEDPNAAKRFWFEHATGAGKTVAALGFVEASQTGGVLILTHRRNLVDQFLGELRDRGYAKRISRPLLKGEDSAKGPVTVETYQWFVRNAGKISSAYTIVICDEAHTALGEKTSAAIREWTGPIFIGMTATGALIARHVTDLFPTQTSRFDLAAGGAPRRDRAAALRAHLARRGRAHDRQGAAAPRRGRHRVRPGRAGQTARPAAVQPGRREPLQDALQRRARASSTRPACATPTTSPRRSAPRASRRRRVSGETPKRELAEILARYERGDIDVLINAQLLAEGWNSPRATVCVHLAPTASKRIYQQRVGRVTRRHPGKEAGLVVDFVHPATKHDDPVVTLHSLLDRDVYRGGAIVVGPVRRGRGRRDARRAPRAAGVRRGGAALRGLRARAVADRRRAPRLRRAARVGGAGRRARGAQRLAPGARDAALRPHRRAEEPLPDHRGAAQQEPAAAAARARPTSPRCATPTRSTTAIDIIGGWPREERKEATKIMLRALVERRIGRRDQANAWIWRLAEYTRDVHEEYAVQRWPETKRLLGLLVNSAGGAHARNARRLIHAARKQDRRLAAALLAAALAHTPEAEEALRGARTRMARKPPALARELLRNFPKRRARNAPARGARARKGGANGSGPRGDAARGRARRAQRPATRTSEARASELRARRGARASRPARRRPSGSDGERGAETLQRDVAELATSPALEPPVVGRAGSSSATIRAPASRVDRRVARERRRPLDSSATSRPRSASRAAPRPSSVCVRQGVARAPGSSVAQQRSSEARSSAPSSRSSVGSIASEARRAWPARRAARPAARRGARRRSAPIPSTAQPSCGRPSIEDPGELASAGARRGSREHDDVVRPLDHARSLADRRRRRRPRRAAAAAAAGERSTQRHQQRAARRAPTSAGPGGRGRRSARRR